MKTFHIYNQTSKMQILPVLKERKQICNLVTTHDSSRHTMSMIKSAYHSDVRSFHKIAAL
jgi:hypothetical protein